MSFLRLSQNAEEHTSVKFTTGPFKKHYYRHGGIWREIEVGFDKLFIADRFDGSNGLYYTGSAKDGEGIMIKIDPEHYHLREKPACLMG